MSYLRGVDGVAGLAAMTPDELLRRLRKNREIRRHLRVEKSAGKGSHRMVYYKDRKATLRRRKEMNPGVVKAFLKQLGIDPGTLS